MLLMFFLSMYNKRKDDKICLVSLTISVITSCKGRVDCYFTLFNDTHILIFKQTLGKILLNQEK